MQRSTILSNSSCANTANILEAGSPPFLLLMPFGSSCERTNLAPDSCLCHFQGVSGNYCWRSSVDYDHLWFVTSPCDVEPLFALLSQHMWNSTSSEHWLPHWLTTDVMMTRTALPLTLRCTNNTVSLQWSHDLLFFFIVNIKEIVIFFWVMENEHLYLCWLSTGWNDEKINRYI